MRRLLTFSFFLLLLFLLSYYGLNQGLLRLPWLKQLPTIQNPVLSQTSVLEIIPKINNYRVSHSLSSLPEDSAVCQFNPSSQNDVSTQEFLMNCPSCNHVSLISVSRLVSPNELLTALINDPAINDTLLDTATNLLCVKETDQNLLFYFATRTNQDTSKPANITPQTIKPKPAVTKSPPKTFSESELWQALSQYRRAHGRSELNRDEALCAYARKRLADHLLLMANTKPEAYPVPEKYPLDAHTGFSADADSGVAFDLTNKSHLAENLAYWPDAESPVQVIEWGWDSSTEGHKEAQLSNDWTDGCISNQEGFYVAIFGT